VVVPGTEDEGIQGRCAPGDDLHQPEVLLDQRNIGWHEESARAGTDARRVVEKAPASDEVATDHHDIVAPAEIGERDGSSHPGGPTRDHNVLQGADSSQLAKLKVRVDAPPVGSLSRRLPRLTSRFAMRHPSGVRTKVSW
jgi:hypothetical protein